MYHDMQSFPTYQKNIEYPRLFKFPGLIYSIFLMLEIYKGADFHISGTSNSV